MLRTLRTPAALAFTFLIAVACGSSASSNGFGVSDGGIDGSMVGTDGATGDGASSGGSSGGSGSSGGKGSSSSGSGSGGGGTIDAGCYPDGVTCTGSTALTCKNGKTTSMKCSGSDVCAPGYGCLSCVPGSGSCSGNVGTECNPNGTGKITNNCDPKQGETCDPGTGTCLGTCASLGASYIGCEYYAVTMANSALDQSTFVFSVAIANTGSHPASIDIEGGALATPMTGTIAPGAIQGYTLPWVPAISTVTTSAITAAGAYHVRSTEPVTVYEFNARDYVVGSSYSFTNDASLLLPVNAMTGNYYVAAPFDFSNPSYVTIIGTQAGTQVTLATATTVSPGTTGLSGTGGTFTLNAGDVLQLMTPGTGGLTYGGDLSGSTVKATAPVEVFGGNDCIYIPAATGYCDHIEQVNFPVETLGSDYLVTLPTNDNDTPRQFVKIVGTVNATTLTYDGISGPATTVNAGAVVYFETTTDFRVTSTHPVEVAQFMEGQNAFGPCVGLTAPAGETCGDPAMSMTVASPQFRDNYPFTSPANYYENWVNVIAPTGTTVTITDTPTNHTVTTGTAIGASGYYVAHVSLCANNLASCTGNHTASASAAFGLQVYGYGTATSYMYPGGLNLNRN